MVVPAVMTTSLCNVIDHPVRDENTKTVEHAADVAAGGKASCDRTETCLQNCADAGRICPGAARNAALGAVRATAHLKRDSSLFSPDSNPNFTFLKREDIVIEEKLGEGGFSNVHRCIVPGRREGEQEFAVKYLKRKVMLDPHSFKLGAADLATEAWYVELLLCDLPIL
jgi:hypothetical protein